MKRYNRLFHLESNKEATLANRLVNGCWNWEWLRDFTGSRTSNLVNAMINEIDHIQLTNSDDDWLWEASIDGTFKMVTQKINVFIWRVVLNRLPTRLNLSARCIEIQRIGCVLCDWCVESLNHVLFSCSMAFELWRKIRVWVDVQIPVVSSWKEWIQWFDGWHVTAKKEDTLYVIISTLLWHIWRYKNAILFNSKSFKKNVMFDSIRSVAYKWVSSRGKLDTSWNSWLISPL
ncbi:uncharacterized protein [Rutidosis leptorrhynchoides]|uniref:uncharacterized protein n=1 Tax=Rutidosis leptorrhynchoides TaxID=125765 RepID=UPI003A994112